MADKDVGEIPGEGLGCGDILDTGFFHLRREKIFQVSSDFASALKAGKIPAEAGAEFDNGVLLSDCGELFSAEADDPRDGLVGNGAFLLLIALPGCAAVKIFGGLGHRREYSIKGRGGQSSLSGVTGFPRKKITQENGFTGDADYLR